MVASTRWASIRIMIGTILGGVLGFYVMHRVEINYKVPLPPPPPCLCALSWRMAHSCYTQEKMKERLARYEQEMERKEQQRLQNEPLSDSWFLTRRLLLSGEWRSRIKVPLSKFSSWFVVLGMPSSVCFWISSLFALPDSYETYLDLNFVSQA